MDRNYDRGAASNFCSMYYGLQLWPDSRPVSSTGRALSRLSAGSPVRVRTLSVVTACDMQSQLVKVLHFHVLSRAVRKKIIIFSVLPSLVTFVHSCSIFGLDVWTQTIASPAAFLFCFPILDPNYGPQFFIFSLYTLKFVLVLHDPS